MKQRPVRQGDQTAVFEPATAKWLIETVKRLAFKLDNARNFARNGPRELVAHPLPKIPRQLGVSPPASVVVAKVTAISNNYISVKKVDSAGAETGDAFNVAKPYMLRHVAANYGATSISTTNAQQMNVTLSGGEVETWAVTPEYAVGAQVHIMPVSYTGVSVSGEDLKWLDLNVDSRAWAVMF